jgi:hypothetical protein
MVVSLHFFQGSPLSRNEPSRFPKVISEEESVSATLLRSKKGLSEGGRILVSGNADPSMISPTPVMDTIRCVELLLVVIVESPLCEGEAYAVLKLISKDKERIISLSDLVIIFNKKA